MIHIIQQSCLEKIRIDATDFKEPYLSASAVAGEEFAYQIALYSDSDRGESVSFRAEYQGELHLYEVKQVPVNWPHYSDDPYKHYLTDTPCLLPDALVPIALRKTLTINRSVTVLWVQFSADFPGDYEIKFLFETEEGEMSSCFNLRVLSFNLPPQRFSHCQYIDPASIAAAYGKPMFSDRHWELLDAHFEIAAKHSVNNLLTPIYPPVYGDQLLGNETVQLVKITASQNDYIFNYDLLDCWVMFAKKHGISKLTFPPIVPSIETLRCPKIRVTCDWREEWLFDENDDVLSPKFYRFIRKFFRNLIQHMKEIGAHNMMCFQISHHPTVQYAENYARCRALIDGVINQHQIADIHVTPEFHELNLGSAPFFSMEDLDGMLQLSVDRHICTNVYSPNAVTNFLIASPSVRIRALGALFYQYSFTSLFSLWFNNSFSPNGDRTDVCMNTSNENAFPSGSGFLVYPGINGPIPSIRLKQLHFAFQDTQILTLLSRHITFERTRSKIKKLLAVSIDKLPSSAEKFLKFREEVYNIFNEK